MTRYAFAAKLLGSPFNYSSSELSAAEKRIRNIVAAAAKQNDNDLANEGWIYESSLWCIRSYIKVFNLLRAGRYYDAWCLLEQIEIRFATLFRNNEWIDLEETGLRRISQMVGQWQSLYPYKLFLSPGFVCKKKVCSICGEQITLRKRCLHRKGYLYNGQMCAHSLQDMSVKEISIVTYPVQKYSVLSPETQNYKQLKYVIDRVAKPFDFWESELTKKAYPRHRFNLTSPEDDCPCQSGREFRICCYDKDEVVLPHLSIGFEKPIPKHLEFDLLPGQ